MQKKKGCSEEACRPHPFYIYHLPHNNIIKLEQIYCCICAQLTGPSAPSFTLLPTSMLSFFFFAQLLQWASTGYTGEVMGLLKAKGWPHSSGMPRPLIAQLGVGLLGSLGFSASSTSFLLDLQKLDIVTFLNFI